MDETFDIAKWKSQSYHQAVDFSSLGEIKKTGLSPDILEEIG